MRSFFVLPYASRLEIDDLEKASIENEVYDTDIDGHDDVLEEETSDTACEHGDNRDHGIELVTPANVVETEYCITSSTKIIGLLYCIHGHLCKRIGCDQQVQFQKTFVGTCLVVN